MSEKQVEELKAAILEQLKNSLEANIGNKLTWELATGIHSYMIKVINDKTSNV